MNLSEIFADHIRAKSSGIDDISDLLAISMAGDAALEIALTPDPLGWVREWTRKELVALHESGHCFIRYVQHLTSAIAVFQIEVLSTRYTPGASSETDTSTEWVGCCGNFSSLAEAKARFSGDNPDSLEIEQCTSAFLNVGSGEIAYRTKIDTEGILRSNFRVVLDLANGCLQSGGFLNSDQTAEIIERYLESLNPKA